jgi:microcystin-dependent protein
VNTGPIVGPQGPIGPQGDQGPQGDAATLSVGTVTVVDPNVSPDVVNSGTTGEAVLDFDLPRAPAFSVGTVSTGDPGSSAAVVNSGTGGDVVLDFSIPEGQQGIQGIQGDIGPEGPSGAPTGSIMMFGGSSAPSGWRICDGSAVSRSTFSALFSVVGTAFGLGDGSTTFNLPDMRLRFSRGVGTGAAMGTSGGSDSHSHGNVAGSVNVDHSHNVSANGSSNTSNVADHKHSTSHIASSGNTSGADLSINVASASHGHGVANTFGTTAHNHGFNAPSTTANSVTSSHTHGSGNISTTRNEGNAGAHGHSFSVSSSGNTSNTGGTKNFTLAIPSVPDLPSYVSVNYIIKT